MNHPAPSPLRTRTAVQALLQNTRILGRTEVREAVISLEDVAAGHAKALEAMALAAQLQPDGSFVHRNVIWLCSRRAAKSTSIMALMAHDASIRDGVQIYFGKAKPAVKLSIWTRIWKPLCDRFYKGKCVHSETMVTTFTTGAVVAFTGTDDQGHIETYLGNKFRRVVIDECQSQSPSVLNPLVDVILPPAISDSGGQLLLAGTIPEVPAGKFYDLWISGEGWLKRNWNRFDNPHLGTVEHQMVRLHEFLKTSGRSIDDPLIRRDWYGEFIFDVTATAHRYDVKRNGYIPEEPEWVQQFLDEYSGDPFFAHFHRTLKPTDGTARHGLMVAKPWPGIEVFACAIDPGARDRFSISVIGWGSGTPYVQHVLEFSSKRKAGLSWAHLDPLRRKIQEVLAPSWWFYDASGSKVVLDTFVGDTGLPALLPAAKSGLKGQVERVASLQLMGLDKTMIGSATEEDYQKARWDPDARAKMQWRWASQWHPDPAESKRYAMGAYFEIFEPAPDEKTQEQIDREAHELTVRRQQAARSGRMLEEDLDTAYAEEDETQLE